MDTLHVAALSDQTGLLHLVIPFGRLRSALQGFFLYRINSYDRPMEDGAGKDDQVSSL